MIIDKETNIVYFSDLIEKDIRFIESFIKIKKILNKNNVHYEFLKGTKDIWARDYMPVQKDLNSFVQFGYEPSYLDEDLAHRSDPSIISKLNNINPKFSNINLDGGNVIKWYNKVIVTARIIRENPSYEKNQLLDEIGKLLNVHVIIIPDIHPANDMTGHADGHVRFLNESTILVNELKNEFSYWRDDFLRMIKQTDLKYIEIPWFEYKEKKFPESAIGGYLNFLEIGDLIILPIFEVTGNKDLKVIDLFKSYYKEKVVETININDIARFGGLMNCITWNIRI